LIKLVFIEENDKKRVVGVFGYQENEGERWRLTVVAAVVIGGGGLGCF
jgi:succinate dehydrogenase/fumarate reductase flavoprotein subunit